MYFGRGSNNVIECRLERERSVEQSGPDGKQNSSDLCGYLPGYGLFEVPTCVQGSLFTQHCKIRFGNLNRLVLKWLFYMNGCNSQKFFEEMSHDSLTEISELL